FVRRYCGGGRAAGRIRPRLRKSNPYEPEGTGPFGGGNSRTERTEREDRNHHDEVFFVWRLYRDRRLSGTVFAASMGVLQFWTWGKDDLWAGICGVHVFRAAISGDHVFDDTVALFWRERRGVRLQESRGHKHRVFHAR